MLSFDSQSVPKRLPIGGTDAGGPYARHLKRSEPPRGVELIAGDAAQLRKNGCAISADIDVGIGRIKGDGLVRIEDERPRTASMLDGIECAGPLQRCFARIDVESERQIVHARQRAPETAEQRLGCFVERIALVRC
jgi:hypothetical protein